MQAKQSPYAKLIFREVFNSEQTVRENGGVPTEVTFSKGVASCITANSSKIVYSNLNLNGLYSVRIRFKTLTPVISNLIVDFRGSTGGGTGLIQIGNPATTITTSSGNIYVDGVSTDAISSNTKEIIVSGISILTAEIYFNCRYSSSSFGTADYDLFEIYKGMLTASEAKNLYDNKWNTELISPSLLLDFDSTTGQLIDRTGKNTLTPTDVNIKKIGSNYSSEYNTTTSKIDCGSDFIGTKPVTVCVWFNPRTFGGGIAFKGRLCENINFSIAIGDSGVANKSVGVSSDRFSTFSQSETNSVKLETYQFVAVTRKSDGKVSFYIGDLKTAPTLSGITDQNGGTPVAGDTNVVIGNRSDSSRNFDGTIPILKVYEGILDLETITNIWSSTRNKIQ